MTTSYDRSLAGYHSHAVDLRCSECGEEVLGMLTSEYGQSWTEPEECPSCGSSVLEATPLDAQDIAELRAEARGEDF